MSNAERAEGPTTEQGFNISWIVNVVNNASGPIALHHREKKRTVTLGAGETKDLSDFPFPWVGRTKEHELHAKAIELLVDGRIKYLLFHEYETDYLKWTEPGGEESLAAAQPVPGDSRHHDRKLLNIQDNYWPFLKNV